MLNHVDMIKCIWICQLAGKFNERKIPWKEDFYSELLDNIHIFWDGSSLATSFYSLNSSIKLDHCE